MIVQTGIGDLSLEQLALRQDSCLFQDVYGLSVLLRQSHSLQL